ncbi:hypothetical protein GDO81_028406 [Engystomops pustulosus]|uniref:Uncharacterized protein n=1 Tax=Engystomops pustulosus TaxID=76066 RepID=A0AAV6YKM6_ENGPU|nr:hypothetical protein GDO81_028406 [Engystomops pustulosus]
MAGDGSSYKEVKCGAEEEDGSDEDAAPSTPSTAPQDERGVAYQRICPPSITCEERRLDPRITSTYQYVCST